MKVLIKKKTHFMMTLQLNKKFDFSLIIILIFSFISCEKPSRVLNHKQMVSVLTDMYKLDAMIYEKGIELSKPEDKELYYTQLLKKHHVMKADFDSSVVWYTKNPKKFDLVFDDVIANLTSFQEDINTNKYLTNRIEREDIWNLQQNYIQTNDSAFSTVDIDVSNPDLLYGDIYELRCWQRIAPQDSSLNQRIVLKINYVKAASDSVMCYTVRDNKVRNYLLRLSPHKRDSIKSISVSLLYSDTFLGKPNSRTHVLSLMRSYSPKKANSIRNDFRKNDSNNLPHTSNDSLEKLNIRLPKSLLKRAVAN